MRAFQDDARVKQAGRCPHKWALRSDRTAGRVLGPEHDLTRNMAPNPPFIRSECVEIS